MKPTLNEMLHTVDKYTDREIEILTNFQGLLKDLNEFVSSNITVLEIELASCRTIEDTD